LVHVFRCKFHILGLALQGQNTTPNDMKPVANLLGFTFFLLGISVVAQPTADPAVPAQTLNEQSKLHLLQSRFGSRFSCSFSSGEKAFHTGSLGMDLDDLRQMMVGFEGENNAKFCLRTSQLPTGYQYLADQKMASGMTFTEISGSQKGNISLSLKIVSPFTPSDSLGDEKAIKCSIVPAFYFVLEAKNTGSKPVKGKLKIGFDAIPYNRDKQMNISWWQRGILANELFFKDNSISNGLIALKPEKAGETRHFNTGSYNGLEYELNLAPGSSSTKTLVYATHNTGQVMYNEKLNQKLTFHYLKYWKSLDQVLDYTIKEKSYLMAQSEKMENFLQRSKRSGEEKWLAALSFRTDIANAFLLDDERGKTWFYNTEGRFRHLNTIDVAHETELVAVFTPWRLKMMLEQWSDYLTFKEQYVGSGRSLKGIKMNLEGVSASELGPFLYHDVGNYPFIFEAEGYDFGPMMPVEENSNFVLLLYWYWKLSSDNAFAARHLGMIDVLMRSLINRDSDGNGLADYGVGWSSYDVSDALKRSPDNVYLGVKQYVAYTLAADLFDKLTVTAQRPKTTPLAVEDEDGKSLDGNAKALFEKSIIDNRYLRAKQARYCREEATKILATLKATQTALGYLPMSLEKSFKGWDQQSILLAEGLFLPGLAGADMPALKELAAFLKPEYDKALAKSQTPYGIKLSSGEDVTWFSKVMVMDGVNNLWFGGKLSHATYAYRWNQNNDQAYQDGAFSLTKEWPGNWYPRGLSVFNYFLVEQFPKGGVQRAGFLKELR
jgi:hypothetical protein